jgi:hypothetical protein
MRPNIQISTDGSEYHIKIENLFEKQTSQVFSFTEPNPTEHNIKLHIHRLFDIFKSKAQTKKQRVRIVRFFAEVRNRAGLLDGLKIQE